MNSRQSCTACSACQYSLQSLLIPRQQGCLAGGTRKDACIRRLQFVGQENVVVVAYPLRILTSIIDIR